MKMTNNCLINKDFDGYSLNGRFLYGRCGAYGLLAIHGARSNHERLDPLLLPLQKLGIGSLSFDLSGHTKNSPLKIN
jgi:hypothetical protein